MNASDQIEVLQRRYPGAVCFRFGDSEQMSAELLELVRAGKKRATCGPLSDFGPDGDEPPVVGRRDIALNWDGSPAVVIETVEVTIQRFDEVDAAFSDDEGETETLAEWQRLHREYFERHGGFSPDMELICERFRLVEDLAE